MPQLPFEIPKSLASYVDHFETDPIKATTRLKEQLKKRGPDAVGHFLLAWFYHLKGMNEEAVEQALKAQTFAPGSPFFEKLHYYLSHPMLFDAWTPPQAAAAKQVSSGSPARGPALDLDALIEKLANVESHRVKMADAVPLSSPLSSEEVDDIASETLANIHETQGKTDAAIRTYKRLKELNKEKREYYKAQINRLKSISDDQEPSNDEKN